MTGSAGADHPGPLPRLFNPDPGGWILN